MSPRGREVSEEPTLQRWLVERIKTWAYRSRVLGRISAPHYGYGLQVGELCAIAQALSNTVGYNGLVLEIGVARGMTTVFLNTYLDELRDDRTYLAVDTFSGFTTEDVEYEVSRRGKQRKSYFGFTYNDATVFQRNMANLGFHRVKVLTLDANSLEQEILGAVSVALLDVDLYRPTLRALEVTYDVLEDGGYIFVDDVVESSIYDGAAQAYLEFTERMDLPLIKVGDKCGVIRKQSVTTSAR